MHFYMASKYIVKFKMFKSHYSFNIVFFSISAKDFGDENLIFDSSNYKLTILIE